MNLYENSQTRKKISSKLQFMLHHLAHLHHLLTKKIVPIMVF